MFSYVRQVWARKSPMWMELPYSSTLAVPEISRIVMPLMSSRSPRENDDGLG